MALAMPMTARPGFGSKTQAPIRARYPIAKLRFSIVLAKATRADQTGCAIGPQHQKERRKDLIMVRRCETHRLFMGIRPWVRARDCGQCLRRQLPDGAFARLQAS